MKSEVTKEQGVRNTELDVWLAEFIFRQRIIDEGDLEGFYIIYCEILKKLLE
jgi:hypothetical protein